MPIGQIMDGLEQLGPRVNTPGLMEHPERGELDGWRWRGPEEHIVRVTRHLGEDGGRAERPAPLLGGPLRGAGQREKQCYEERADKCQECADQTTIGALLPKLH